MIVRGLEKGEAINPRLHRVLGFPGCLPEGKRGTGAERSPFDERYALLPFEFPMCTHGIPAAGSR